MSAMAAPLALPMSSPGDVVSNAAPLAAQTQMARHVKRQGGPAIPLPEAGETLFSFLDRLLANLPLLGKLMAGLGYVRPK
ncbi:hypothetical protein GGH94_005644 [Coemansia aciculifera]|uniref:Uncharacterized protein n=1 Tax=Coemansia aciculifera TaxID=417176 RepID=A0A9W8IDF1_9FUNG|nr:hypothetical protein GGH94_005644 [Coemansia aciculifera]KAJ2870315.1 hypothetical protein GGH93_005666 [Coemansia aciculifera]